MITNKEVRAYGVTKTLIANNYEKDNAKSLEVELHLYTLSAKYLVIDHELILYRGENLDEAIRVYNEVKE